MNTDAANSGVFFAVNLGKKRPKEAAYSLVGVDAAALHRYANQRVAVEGILLPPAQPGATRPDSSVAVSTGKSASDKSAPGKAPAQFRVTAIKQIPGSCGGR
jgi:hypothetical protein